MNDLKRNLTLLRAQSTSSGPQGFVDTAVGTVKLFWSDGPIPRVPLAYDPGIAVLVSGRKIGYVGDRQIVYEPGTCLAVGLPLSFECVTVASAENPVIGLYVQVEPGTLTELAAGSPAFAARGTATRSNPGAQTLPLSAAMEEASIRLSAQLLDAQKAALLGPGTVREFFFHALQDPRSAVLLMQSGIDRPEMRIGQMLRGLKEERLSFEGVDALARQAGMSKATFYRHFKAVTGYAPKQYFKRDRLMRAKSMLVFEGASVTQAAYANGYASPSQFSREFRAFFEMPPSRARDLPSAF